MKSYFVNNEGVHIHVLEQGTPEDRVPSLLVIGGFWEPAERAIPVISGIQSHVVALSLRGRGLSSTPAVGYDLAENLSDIEAVVKHCQLKNYCLLGFSRGAAYALGWSLQHQSDLSGLILVDQPPIHTKPVDNYVEFWSAREWMGVPLINYIRRETLEGLKRDSVQVDFSEQLNQIKLPVKFFVGRNEQSETPSNVTDEHLQTYKNAIEDFTVEIFKESGHMIPDDEPQKYVDEVRRFIQTLSKKM